MGFYFCLRENNIPFNEEKKKECEYDKTPDGESHIRYGGAHESTWYLRDS